jgi:hypothetical protein
MKSLSLEKASPVVRQAEVARAQRVTEGSAPRQRCERPLRQASPATSHYLTVGEAKP